MILDAILIIICALMTFFLFSKLTREPVVFRIFIFAFLVRLFLLYIDYNQIYIVPSSGADSEFFNEMAIDNQVAREKWYSTNYELFLTIVYGLTNCSRLFAQYLNVMMGMIFLLYLNKTLKLLSIFDNTRFFLLKVASFMPNLIIFSSILLREAWIEMFIMMSLYYYILWFTQKGKWNYAIISLFCVMASSWMHSGSALVAVGYMISFIIYDKRHNRIRFSKTSMGALIVVASFASFVFTHSEILLSKLRGVNDTAISDLMVDNFTPSVDAGSLYLQWLTVTTPLQGVIYSPLKMFYFLFSPIPFDWRGAMDVVAFVFDSCFYLFLFYGVFKKKIYNRKAKLLRFFIMLSFVLTTFVFSVGTLASGTAIRHRAKTISLLFVCYGISTTYGKKKAHFSLEKKRVMN